MKNEKEMLDYIERFITQQGNEGAMKISPLLIKSKSNIAIV